MPEITDVFNSAHSRTYPKGQILLYQGEKTDDVLYISNGYIKVYDVTATGTEKLLLILGRGDMFPIVWTLDQSDALHYFYETMNVTDVNVIKKRVLIESINENHEITLHLLRYFVARTKDLMTRLECIEAAGSKHKVVQVLLYLAEAHGQSVAQQMSKIEIPLTHQIIADMSGLTRETVSIQFKELEKEKLVQNDEFLFVHTDRLTNFLKTE